MKNPRLYISPWGNQKQKHAFDVARTSSSKEKCNAVLSDVPTMYRRTKKKTFIDFLLTATAVIGLTATIMFMLVTFA